MTSEISPEKYIMPFGKYKGMYASDVAQITVVDKSGNDKSVGLNYLQWIVKQDWFTHKETIQKIIKNNDNGMTDEDTETKELVEEIKKPKVKKEAKLSEKKPKKAKEGTVQISRENNIVEFQ